MDVDGNSQCRWSDDNAIWRIMDALTGSIGDLSDNVEHGMAWHGMAWHSPQYLFIQAANRLGTHYTQV